jgi:exodeoxyribonuclease V alpha subunit
MESFRILCAIRSGLTGVENVNRIAAAILNLRSLHSVGMPLIVLENTPLLGLSNGDVGLVWKPKNSTQTVVAFPGVNRSFKIVRFAEMPPFEQVFAMTVHKSQGSGFDNVMILLPPKDVPVLTRELIYTAVTRAKKSVRIYASEEILKKTLGTATVRYSGMADQLKEYETNEP